MPLLRELTDVEVAGAELEGRRDGVLLVVGGGAGEVEVHPVAADLLRVRRDEPEAHLGVVARQQGAAGLLDHLPTEQARPELRQPGGVVRVEGQRQQS